MRVSDAFPGKYLKAADLPTGQNVTVNIHYVQMETMEQSDDSKPVVYFAGKNKGLVLNKTNAATIAGMHGQETDDWQGKEIVIYATETLFRGEMVPCLRVRGIPHGQRSAQAPADQSAPPVQPQPAPPAEDNDPSPDDDIPF